MSDAPINPKILAKLKDANLEELAEILSRPVPTAPRVEPDQLDEVPTYEDDDVFSDRWSPEKVDGRGLYQLRIQSPKSRFGRYIFLATEDWREIAVPLDLLPPEYLGDDLLKRWHWWRGEGSETIRSEASAIEFAESLVRQFHGLKPSVPLPNYRIHPFDIRTAKAVHQFMTMENWTGLWCANYMAPEGSSPDQINVRWTRLLDSSQISGEKEILKYAARYARAFDRLKNKPNPRPAVRNLRAAHYFYPETRDKIEQTKRYLAAINPNGCSDSRAVRYLIDEGFKSVPPESEWGKLEPLTKEETE